MTRRIALFALAAGLVLWGSGVVMAAPVLSVDFDHNVPPVTPTQPGFTSVSGGTVESSHSEVVSGFTVKVEGGGFYHAGFNAGNVHASVAPLFEDYYYNNATDPNVGVKVTITGVTPNAFYAIQLWSYDEDNIFSVTPTLWGSASGSATTGTTGLVSDSGAAPYPTTLSEKTAIIRLSSTTNELAFFGASTGGGGGTRLNGFQMTPVPEPTGVLLVGAAGAGLAAGRRKLRVDCGN